jgi:DNA adenine methylase
VTRAALRYYGGKWRLAPWIVAHLPDHACYVEPYGGAASVLLRKPPARYEVYNDLDGDVVGFFRVLRERPDELLEALRRTPFARAEIDLACTPAPSDLDEVERARRVYVRSWQGRHGLPARGRLGWRFERAATRRRTVVQDWRDVAHLWAVSDRLRRVQLECDDALRVIERFAGIDTLVYIDPPYPASTRGKRWARHAYAHELTDDDHRRLAGVLRVFRGMARRQRLPLRALSRAVRRLAGRHPAGPNAGDAERYRSPVAVAPGRRTPRRSPTLPPGGTPVTESDATTSTFRVTLPNVVSWSRPRRVRGGVRYPRAYVQNREAWATVVAHAVLCQQWHPPPKVRYVVTVTVYGGGRRDLDRVCTAVLDALQAGNAVRDDCLVDELTATRSPLQRGGRPTTMVEIVSISESNARRRRPMMVPPEPTNVRKTEKHHAR